MRSKIFLVTVIGCSFLVPDLQARECCHSQQGGRVSRTTFFGRLRNRLSRPPSKCACCQCCSSKPAAEPLLKPVPTADAISDTREALLDAESEPAKSNWRSMFNGKDLGQWKITEFGGEGDVLVEEGLLKLGFGQYLTGVTYQGKDLPTNSYEIEVEAMREEGSDFFCGLTFPVDDSHCSMIAGGWGGSVVGISSIDDMDASENNTTSYIVFKNKQWYTFRVRITPGRLEVWIDEDQIIDEDVEGRKLSTRIEVDRSIPFGIASFDTAAAIRSIRVRELDDAEVKAIAASKVD